MLTSATNDNQCTWLNVYNYNGENVEVYYKLKYTFATAIAEIEARLSPLMWVLFPVML